MSEKIEFIELDKITGYTHRRADYVDKYVISAILDDGVAVYEYTNTGELQLKQAFHDGKAYSVSHNNNTVYVGYDDGLRVYSLNTSTGELTLIDFDNSKTSIRCVRYSEHADRIFTANLTNGLAAWSFDGSTLTYEDGIDDTSGGVWGIETWDDFVFAVDTDDGMIAYSYIADTFTRVDALDNGGFYYDITLYGSIDELPMGACPYYIIANSLNPSSRLYIYMFDGTTLTLHDTWYKSSMYYLDSDDKYLYVSKSGSAPAMLVLTYDGTDVTIETTYTLGTNTDYHVNTISSNVLAITNSDSGLALVYIDDKNTCRETFNIIGGGELVRLHKPQWNKENRKISKSIDVFDFWDDTFDTVDIGKNNEPLSLSGIEVVAGMNEGICFPLCFPLCFSCKLFERFNTINDLANNNEEIKVEGLGDCIDGVYVIKSFSYNTVKRINNAYEWHLELEWKEAIS